MAFEDELEDSKEIFEIIELVILFIFLLEIGLRIIAFGHVYIKSFWNIFDIIVVLLCSIVVVLNLVDNDLTDSSFLKVGVLLRLLRLLVVFRKVNDLRVRNERRVLINKLSNV